MKQLGALICFQCGIRQEGKNIVEVAAHGMKVTLSHVEKHPEAIYSDNIRYGIQGFRYRF